MSAPGQDNADELELSFWVICTDNINYRCSEFTARQVRDEYEKFAKLNEYHLIEFEDFTGEAIVIPIFRFTQFFRSTPESRRKDYTLTRAIQVEKNEFFPDEM